MIKIELKNGVTVEPTLIFHGATWTGTVTVSYKVFKTKQYYGDLVAALNDLCHQINGEIINGKAP